MEYTREIIEILEIKIKILLKTTSKVDDHNFYDMYFILYL